MRFALRRLIATPASSATIVVTLTVGLAAISFIAAIAYGVLLRPLPYPNPSRLVDVATADRDGRPGGVSLPDIDDWRSGATTLQALGAYVVLDAALETSSGTVPVRLAAVEPEVFEALGARPALGRALTRGDDRSAAVVLSWRTWQRLFAGQPFAAGTALRLNGESATLVGVADARTTFPGNDVDAWIPLSHARQSAPPQWNMRGFRGFHAVARLRGDASVATASADLAGIARRLAAEYPQFNDGVQTSVMPLAKRLAAPVKKELLLLFAGAVLLLLVTCGNAAALSLTRAATREHEWALRVALGARASRIVREALAEAALLAAAGAVCGLTAAWALVRWFMHAHPDSFPRLESVRLDLPVIAFATLAAACAAMVTAAAPALRATRAAPASALKDARSAGHASRGLHRALVAGQIALAVTLLISATVLIRQLSAALSADVGAAHVGVLTARIDMTAASYARADAQRALMRRLLEELENRGRTAGLVSSVPPATGQMRTTIHPVADDRLAADVLVDIVAVTPGSLDILGVPLLSGRGFTPADTDSSTPVAVLSATAAQRLFPGRNPIGLQVPFGGGRSQPIVVGIAGDVRYRGIDAPAGAAMYLPASQRSFRTMYAVVASDGEAETSARGLLAAVRASDPSIAATEVKTLTALRREAAAGYAFRTSIVSTLALAALFLAGAGIFGVTAQAAAQRRRELALRIALGGQRSQVLRLIVGESAGLCAAGAGAGVLLAAATHRFSGVVLALPPADMRTAALAVAAAMVLGVGVAIVPAVRAVSADPSALLRG